MRIVNNIREREGKGKIHHFSVVHTVYMSLLPCVHLKNDVFYLSFLSHSYQNNTLSLPNVVTYPALFLNCTQKPMTFVHLCWVVRLKNPDLYYYLCIKFIYNRYWLKYMYTFIIKIQAFLLLTTMKRDSMKMVSMLRG